MSINPSGLPRFVRRPARFEVVLCLTSGRLSGVDVFSIHLARALSAKGVPTRILLTQHDYLPPDPLPLPADVPCERLALDRGTSLQARWKTLIQRLGRGGPCIYIPNYDYDHSWACMKFPEHVAAVGIVHSDDPLHYEHTRRLGRYWNGIVAVSQHIAETVAQIDETFASRLHVIPYGVTACETFPERPATPGRPLRVLYVGRMDHQQKRPLDVVRVAARVAALGAPIELTMIGGGDGTRDVAELARQQLAPGTYALPGILPNEEVLHYYQHQDVLLLTSAFEGLPVAMLEAMARGCIPVVSRVASGIPEIIAEDQNGLTAPIGDIEQFATHLRRLQQDAALRYRLAVAAHETIVSGGYLVEDMANRYADLFDQVLADATSGAYRRPAGQLPSPPLAGALPYRIWRAGRHRLANMARPVRTIAKTIAKAVIRSHAAAPTPLDVRPGNPLSQ